MTREYPACQMSDRVQCLHRRRIALQKTRIPVPKLHSAVKTPRRPTLDALAKIVKVARDAGMRAEEGLALSILLARLTEMGVGPDDLLAEWYRELERRHCRPSGAGHGRLLIFPSSRTPATGLKVTAHE